MPDSAATRRAGEFLARLADAVSHPASAASLFAEDGYWRDLTALTWNIHTAEGRPAIQAMLEATAPTQRPTNWRLDGDASEVAGITEAWFTFETAVARARGHLRLRDGACWTLLTAMQELKGFEEKQGPTRPEGVELGAIRGRRTWLERKQQEEAELGITRQPYCLVIGGGQGGIGLGARLRRLDVPTLVIDKHPRPGDAWRQRYKSLCLHDTVWYDHMPYLPFPEHWPVYSPKDQIGDWLEMYTKVMELNYWPSTECRGARYDEAAGEWIVEVVRDRQPVTLRPKQLILATGMAGMPDQPRFPGADIFRGVQRHSSQHRNGEPFAGKRCVIIGSNNSAHDICADLWEHGAAEITMVQRSSTLVARTEKLRELSANGVYSEAAAQARLSTDTADLTVAAMPYRLQAAMQTPATTRIREEDAAFYDRLRAVGFLLDFGDDGSGLSMKYLRRGSGYYIDVGASELIASGEVKLKSGVAVSGLDADGVLLSDGTHVPADLVVYATGYGSMNGWAARLISQEVADKVGKCWGLGSDTAKDPGPWEGELRNMWKPTRQEALWFHGGNLAQSRHYSRYLALQMKARMEGIPTPVYGLPPVHHLS